MESENRNTETQQTVVSFVLDESGSMGRAAIETVEGFNEYMASLREDPSSTILHLVTFNSRKRSVAYDFEDLKEISDLDVLGYMPRGGTPLLDAIGTTIESTEKYLTRSGLKDPQVIVTILTDGMENASRIFTKNDVSKLITEKEKEGWSFTYLGAGPATWEQGRGMGIRRRDMSEFDPSNPKKAFRRSAREVINLKQYYRENRR